MNSLIQIGSTAVVRDIMQSRRSDFVWSIDFFDVDENDVATPQDVTGCQFEFVVFAQDGITEILTLSELSGITVLTNNAQVDISLEQWTTWARGCRYPYLFRKTSAGGVRTALFEGNFILS